MTCLMNKIGFAAVFGVLVMPAALAQRSFDPMFRIAGIQGTCLVRTPGATAFRQAREGWAYPYGSTVSVETDADATLMFSNDDFVTISRGAKVIPEHAGTREENRLQLRFERGRLVYTMREAIGEANRFQIITPSAMAENLKLRGEITLADRDGMTEMTVRPRSGSLDINGAQFAIGRMRSGMAASITMAHDRTYTAIENLSGDFTVVLDSGEEQPVLANTTPRAVVKMWRKHAPVGGRLIVSVLAIGADGRPIHRFAYTANGASDTRRIESEPPPVDDDENAGLPFADFNLESRPQW